VEILEYNLIEEQWIPVLWMDGRPGKVGIREALAEAGRVRQIAASNPMDRVAILRFLLAVLYWCKGNPTENYDSGIPDSFPTNWFSKLDEHKDCFNILGDGERFYQCHAVNPCKSENREHEVIPLIHEIPNGDDKWHFRHSTDKVNGLCCDCCALGLLRLPVFTTGEGRGWHQGINGAPPIYVIAMGKTLIDTLILNWIPTKHLGEPSWLQPGIRPRPGKQVPLLLGLTDLPRRVWLHDPVEGVDSCIACGSKGMPIITTCEYQSAGPLSIDNWDDPHVIYLVDNNKRKGILAINQILSGNFRKQSSTVSYFDNRSEYSRDKADGFRMDRPWLDLLARVVEIDKFNSRNTPRKLFVAGFSTDKAKNIDSWERTVDISPGSVVSALSSESIRQWKEEGFKLPRDLRNKVKHESSREHIELVSCIVSIRPHIESQVSGRIDELLAGDEAVWQQAAAEYQPMMKAISKSLSPGFTTSALKKRRQIEKIMPYMGQKTAVSKKPSSKKGGGK